MDHTLNRFVMGEASRSKGWNWKLRLPALAEHKIFGHRVRESTWDERAFLTRAAATNLRNATDYQPSAKDDLAGIGRTYGVLASALTIISAVAGNVYDWFGVNNDPSEHLLLPARPGDIADGLCNISFPTEVFGLSKVLDLPIWPNPAWRPDAADLPARVLTPQQVRA